MITTEDLAWLAERLHAKHCRQCDLVRQLIAERAESEASRQPIGAT